jgi:hypothetical protein
MEPLRGPKPLIVPISPLDAFKLVNGVVAFWMQEQLWPAPKASSDLYSWKDPVKPPSTRRSFVSLLAALVAGAIMLSSSVPRLIG